MTAPITTDTRADRLAPDVFRTVIAVLIVLLTIFGWVNVFVETPLRQALGTQTRVWWWIEQFFSITLALLCIGIVMRKRAVLNVAFWLSIYSMAFDIVRWFFELKEGQLRIPVALLLYALLAWRLSIARRRERVANTATFQATT